MTNPTGFPAGRRRVKVAIPLPLISVLEITEPGSSRGWTFIVPTKSKGVVNGIGFVEKGMTTPGPVNCRKLSLDAQVTRTDLPLKVTVVGEPGSELSSLRAVGKIRSPGWQRDADWRHGDMYWGLAE
jgi:hypothetical protein